MRPLLIILLCHAIATQAQYIDLQNDGLRNWLGDTTFFTITDDHKLQANGPAATSRIAIAHPIDSIKDTMWDLWFRCEFNPAAGNHARFYLTSDSPDLKAPLNGYYIKLGGETGNTDKLELFRQEGNTHTRLIQGIQGHVGKSINILKMKVIYDRYGKWHLYSDPEGGVDFKKEGEIIDENPFQRKFFGFLFIHTATRSDKIFFDQIKISSSPQMLVNASDLHTELLELEFNHEFEKNLPPNTIYVNGKNPITIVKIGSKTLHLHLEHPLTVGWNIIDVMDTLLFPNVALSQIKFLHYSPPPYASIVINEIFMNPDPSYGAPLYEFLELYNNSQDTINLKNWQYSNSTATSRLLEYLFPPGQFLLLCQDAAMEEYQAFGNTMALRPWPILKNRSDHISLKDSLGNLIFEVVYQDTWIKDPVKRAGGYSLEMISPDAYCLGQSNWAASESEMGSTPGTSNSVYLKYLPDKGPEIIDISIEEMTRIKVILDKHADIKKANPKVTVSPDIAIESLESQEDTLIVNLTQPLEENSGYLIKIEGLNDCIGITSQPYHHDLYTTLEPDSLDVQISEILFNPPTGVPEFLEICNTSGKYIDLTGWKIVSDKVTRKESTTITEKIILKPFQYMAFTPDPLKLIESYSGGIFENLEEVRLPSYNNDKGIALVLNKDERVIDMIAYNENLHSPMLQNKKGVSLERISFAYPSTDQNNWFSAASSVGYATPGNKNSQQRISAREDRPIYADPELFFPDGDGYKDFTMLSYTLRKSGFMGNITIFDIAGNKAKHIAKNELLGETGNYIWDGSNDNGAKVPPGHYVILAEFYDLNGNYIKHKGVVIVGKRF